MMQSVRREILTRSKTREYEAFYHEDVAQYRMLPPKGSKRKLNGTPDEAPDAKRGTGWFQNGDDAMEVDEPSMDAFTGANVNL